MQIKTGIDIVDVDRIREDIERFGERFLNRVFTQMEIEYCEERNVQKYQSYAGRFAGKEAIFKAVSEKLDNKFDIEWKNIEILNDNSGRPNVILHGNLKKILGEMCELDISISHIAKTAVASVVAQFQK